MNSIIVLDAAPADAGDMDWQAFETLGELQKYDQTSDEQIAERIGDASIVLTNKVAITREIFESCPSIDLVCVLATGFDNIDTDAATEHGVTVCNVPGYSTASTAQLAITLLLQLAYRTGAHSSAVANGQWTQSGIFTFWNHPLVELDGKTHVIVGLGEIGSRTAAIAEALGMRVIAAQQPHRPAGSGAYPRVPLAKAVEMADSISLHCPLNEDTRRIFDAQTFKKMKNSAFVVNVGRGPLVDTPAVIDAVRSGQIAGYATDVLDQEPPPVDHPLIGVDGIIVTPHIGWATHEARTRLLEITANNIQYFLKGNPQHIVAQPNDG